MKTFENFNVEKDDKINNIKTILQNIEPYRETETSLWYIFGLDDIISKIVYMKEIDTYWVFINKDNQAFYRKDLEDLTIGNINRIFYYLKNNYDIDAILNANDMGLL